MRSAAACRPRSLSDRPAHRIQRPRFGGAFLLRVRHSSASARFVTIRQHTFVKQFANNRASETAHFPPQRTRTPGRYQRRGALRRNATRIVWTRRFATDVICRALATGPGQQTRCGGHVPVHRILSPPADNCLCVGIRRSMNNNMPDCGNAVTGGSQVRRRRAAVGSG